MTDLFPQSCRVGQIILKRVLLALEGVKPATLRHAKKVVWAYKLAPGTCNLPATDGVREIEVMDVATQPELLTPKQYLGLAAALDGLVPNPVLFRFLDADGACVRSVMSVKPSGRDPAGGESAAFRYAVAEHDAVPPQGVQNLEELLVGLVAGMEGLSVRPGETLRAYGERRYHCASLRADLAALETREEAERQLNRKYRLHELYRQKTYELEMLTSAKTAEGENDHE